MFLLLLPITSSLNVLQQILFEGPRIRNARILLFLFVSHNPRCRISLGLLFAFPVRLYNAPLNFVLVFERRTLRLAFLLYHGGFEMKC
jgi:hypothetical protein